MNIGTTEWIAISLGILSVLLGVLSISISVIMFNCNTSYKYVNLKREIDNLSRLKLDIYKIKNLHNNPYFIDLYKSKSEEQSSQGIELNKDIFFKNEIDKIICSYRKDYVYNAKRVSQLIKEINGDSLGGIPFPIFPSNDIDDIIKVVEQVAVDTNIYFEKNNIFNYMLLWKTQSINYFKLKKNLIGIINGMEFLESSAKIDKLSKKILRMRKTKKSLESKEVNFFQKQYLKYVKKKIKNITKEINFSIFDKT